MSNKGSIQKGFRGLDARVAARHARAKVARHSWTEARTAKDPDAYIEALRAALPLYNGNVTVELVSVEPGLTKSGRTRFTIRLERDS